MSKLELKLTHLYPEEMNIYGDMGNIITFKRRCEWRGIEFVHQTSGVRDTEIKPADIYFMGGGQDNDMYQVFEDLLNNKKDFIKNEVETGKVFLLICGAFQLFGDFFLDSQNRKIRGLGLIPAETKAPGNALTDRCLGNLVTELSTELQQEISKIYQSQPESSIVGFENHSGQTYFTKATVKPMTKVIYGKGNNAKDKIEGATYKNIFASYTHGSLLPKNPHVADLLIHKALTNKYKQEIKLAILDDEVEWNAHKSIKHKLLNE